VCTPPVQAPGNLLGATQTDVAWNNYVGWVERFFAKPNKPKQQNLFLKFGFVGFRDKAAQPNLHD